MSPQTDFPQIYTHLRTILQPYAEKLTLTLDTPQGISIDGPHSETWKKPLFFASAQIKKTYVSFYLMPVYMFPDLLQGISPELRSHMQGKSCFNFKRVEPDLFQELTELVRLGYERFHKEITKP